MIISFIIFSSTKNEQTCQSTVIWLGILKTGSEHTDNCIGVGARGSPGAIAPQIYWSSPDKVTQPTRNPINQPGLPLQHLVDGSSRPSPDNQKKKTLTTFASLDH